MEIILHVLIPLLLLVAFGLERKSAGLVSLFGAVPDIDVLWRPHRATLHSFLVILIVTTVSVVLVKKYKPKYLKLTFLATLVIFSHLFIDLFFGYVAVAWPISNIAVGIVSHITTNTGNPLNTIKIDFQIQVSSTTETPSIYESNLLTESGVAILLIVILGTLIKSGYTRIKLHRK